MNFDTITKQKFSKINSTDQELLFLPVDFAAMVVVVNCKYPLDLFDNTDEHFEEGQDTFYRKAKDKLCDVSKHSACNTNHDASILDQVVVCGNTEMGSHKGTPSVLVEIVLNDRVGREMVAVADFEAVESLLLQS